MNTNPTPIGRALLSVSDKHGIVALAKELVSLDIEILSTGGTAAALRDAGIPVIPVEQYTQVPEMMDGRVKTIHPKITGGILGLRDRHVAGHRKHDTTLIDLVGCNL